MKNLYRRIYRKLSAFRRAENGPILDHGKGPFIFLHINKTGGTSIGKAIGLSSKQHLTAGEVADIVGMKAYRRAFKFSVIRNPWSRAVSLYNYRIKMKRIGFDNPLIPFAEWARRVFGDERDSRYHDDPKKMLQPQINWLKLPGEGVVVDRILRFEKLHSEWEDVCPDLGVPKDLPHLNKARVVDYRSYYDTESIEIIRQWFEEDIDVFNYDFDNG